MSRSGSLRPPRPVHLGGRLIAVASGQPERHVHRVARDGDRGRGFAFLFSIVGLVLGVVATALGATARSKGARDGKTTAGLALGVVAIVVSIVMMVIAYNVLT